MRLEKHRESLILSVGACFAIDGTLKAISNNIFIVAPGNIEVSGDLKDEIISDSMISPELTKF